MPLPSERNEQLSSLRSGRLAAHMARLASGERVIHGDRATDDVSAPGELEARADGVGSTWNLQGAGAAADRTTALQATLAGLLEPGLRRATGTA